MHLVALEELKDLIMCQIQKRNSAFKKQIKEETQKIFGRKNRPAFEAHQEWSNFKKIWKTAWKNNNQETIKSHYKETSVFPKDRRWKSKIGKSKEEQSKAY